MSGVERAGEEPKRIIEMERSVIPACDVPFEVYKDIINATGDIDKIYAHR